MCPLVESKVIPTTMYGKMPKTGFQPATGEPLSKNETL
jgi:hypothetical protein